MDVMFNLLLTSAVDGTAGDGDWLEMLMSFAPITFILALVCFWVIRSKKKSQNEVQSNIPMKWYNFIVRFALVLGSIVNALLGLQYLTGGIYLESDVTPEAIYALYGRALQVVDIVYGIVLIAFAAFCIYTRQQLAKYKMNAPKCLMIMYVVLMALPILYSVISCSIVGIDSMIGSVISSLGTAVVIGIVLFCNVKYFNKRKNLFVN